MELIFQIEASWLTWWKLYKLRFFENYLSDFIHLGLNPSPYHRLLFVRKIDVSFSKTTKL